MWWYTPVNPATLEVQVVLGKAHDCYLKNNPKSQKGLGEWLKW
jgi:hypothetical protein